MKRLLLCLSLLLITGLMQFTLAAGLQWRVVELRYVSAEEMKALLQPHLPESVALSQQGQRLLISGPHDLVDSMQALAGVMDQQRRTWRVHFVQGPLDLEADQLAGVRRFSTARQQAVQLMVREDASARLDRGFWVPAPAGRSRQHEGYQWLQGGIWVDAASRGDRVLLRFSTQQIQPDQRASAARQPGFATSGVGSELELEPGYWVTLGSESRLAEHSGVRRSTTGRNNDYYSICVEPPDRSLCPR
ncbi:hypothetical protein [Marinospirillum alkaliphilum]|uniref:Type II/III secretion system short domain-containing protein n=1 Tax=Marinospirillum alkaliphilum DSM 21637 TaxID=1122209 RepID=A0A1K1ZGF3_9GAMM|nr:hypothetical protein [Marinospirillum alkaliphilum]SFX72795.1 hypothetical protein SAMN02745752_02661 [Marinospirillum alkaliphilum DSM 21637]